MSELLKTPEPQSETQNVATEEQATAAAAVDASPQVEKKTPGKRTRLSFIERAQKESEELVKNLGGSLEMEGGRRTRSSARGTPSRGTPTVATPPPTKKPRNSPASPKAATPRGRGRGRKLDTSVTPEPPESKEKAEQVVEKTEENEAAEPEKSTEAVEKSAETDNTKESSETNGPEKPETEKGNDKSEQPQADEKQATETVAEEKSIETPATDDSKVVAKDQVDAAAAEPVKEKASQPPAKEVEHKNESEKSSEPAVVAAVDSPMEVEEQSETAAADSSKTNEKAVAEVITVPEEEESTPSVSVETTAAEKSDSDIAATVPNDAVEKQPTPEPMEIDSSSKSSDVIECTDVVDKAAEEEETTAPAVQTNVANDIESTNSHVDAEKAPAIVPPLTENDHKSEINANVKANDIPAVKSIVEPFAGIGEPHVDNNKNENDVDQQKLATAASQLNAVGGGGGDVPVNAVVPTSL